MSEYIPVYLPDFDIEERTALAVCAWESKFLTANKRCDTFEREFAKHHGVRHALFTNSGSSAVMVAFEALEFQPGDRIVTPAVTFGTTLAPIIRAKCVPVFVDVEPGTYNVDADKVFDIVQNTKDIAGCVIPQTLGNVVDAKIWTWFSKSLEDACDALGSTFEGSKCGTFGKISTFSFFPAHHITSIEGGMVLTENPDLHRLAFQYANWGRACWCRAGENSVCGIRFDVQLEDGTAYDHKYIFDRAGYNVRGDELRASIGLLQMKKLKQYEDRRRKNYAVLDAAVRPLEDIIIPPKVLQGADPCWFAYPITLRKGSRKEITQALESKGVGTRLIFCGNAVHHPFMRGVEYVAPHGLSNSDDVCRMAFSVGLNQTIGEEQIERIAKTLVEVLKGA
jgi:CDP-6-deoxy-D-xylo-4-hexulose-3-dehydrase